MTSYSAIFWNYFINWNFRIPIFHKPGFFFHPHRCSCGPLLLRSHPHTPGRYPGCFTNSLWMISFLCRVLGKFGVSSQGSCGQNHWLYIIDYILITAIGVNPCVWPFQKKGVVRSWHLLHARLRPSCGAAGWGADVGKNWFLGAQVGH